MSNNYKSVNDIIVELRATESSKAKEAILKANSDNEWLKKTFEYAYSRRIKFGISYPNAELKPIPEFGTYSYQHVFEMLDKLAAGELTGNAARDHVVSVLNLCSHDLREIIRLILKRDLDCGVGRTMPNKVWSGLLQEQPQCLCMPYSEKNLKAIEYPAYAQLKADGARMFAEVTINKEEQSIVSITLTSRAGNEYQNLDRIRQDIEKFYNTNKSSIMSDFMLDGELVYIADDNTPESRAFGNGICNKSLKGTITQDEANMLSYQIWDFVAMYEVVESSSDLPKAPYSLRYNCLTALFDELALDSNNSLVLIDTTVVNCLEEARLLYKEYVAQGLEGIILKNFNGLWKDGRSKDQIKFKEENTGDFKIVGFKPHSKDPNKVGSLLIESECGVVKAAVGSGLTDTTRVRDKATKEWVDVPLSERPQTDREWLYHNIESMIGTVVEVTYNVKIANKENLDQYSLFLPRVKRFRIDKTVANTFDELDG